jgi:hypothetical protein
MQKEKDTVRDYVATLQTMRLGVARKQKNAMVAGRTTAARAYTSALCGLSRAINRLVLIRDFATRD